MRKKAKACLTSLSVELKRNNSLVVTFPQISDTIVNGDIIGIKIAQDIPTTNPTDNVIFVFNTVNFDVTSKYANFVKQDQLKKDKLYYVGIGAEMPAANILGCIPVSSAVFPTYPPVI